MLDHNPWGPFRFLQPDHSLRFRASPDLVNLKQSCPFCWLDNFADPPLEFIEREAVEKYESSPDQPARITIRAASAIMLQVILRAPASLRRSPILQAGSRYQLLEVAASRLDCLVA